MTRLLPLLYLIATVGGARADDACLTGASLLGDQRAITTVRTDAETACPCAGAESRSAYRRCTKSTLAAALSSGALRAACGTTLKQLFKAASCGTTRKPCGRVRPARDVPVDCKVKRGAACKDHPGAAATACDAEDFCADVVSWTAGTCSDPRLEGPFGVGARVITMTKKSVVSPTTDRVLDTVVWYPTTAGSGSVDPAYGGVLNAPVDGSGGPYPVLVFSHGSCGFPTQSTFLLPIIASRGYVVVAPPHPGNTLYDGPSCNTNLAASFIERPADVMFALDQMLAANADPGSEFHGLLDPSRIGMSGHSFGGLTTYLVVERDPRFLMAVAMAPAGQFAPSGSPVPSLTMVSELDSYVDNTANRTSYGNSASPKYWVEVLNAGHFAYSNGCFPSPDCNPPVTLTQDEAHAAVVRWVVPFVQWKLGGDARFAAFFGPPTPPGVTFDAAP